MYTETTYELNKNMLKDMVLSDHVIHISHNDKDGYACTVLTEMLHRVSPLKDLHLLNIGNFRNMPTYIDDAAHRFPAADKTFILITDIGAVNIEQLFDLCEENPNLMIYWFDHHKLNSVNEKYITPIPEYEDFRAFRSVNLDAEICYEKCGAALYFQHMLYHACEKQFDIDRTQSSQSYRKTMKMLEKLYPNIFKLCSDENVKNYIQLVDQYDRGLWGNWSAEYIPDDVREELFFKGMKYMELPEDTNENRLQPYIDNILERFSTGEAPSGDIVDKAVNDLLREWNRFETSVTSVNTDTVETYHLIVLPGDIRMSVPDRYKSLSVYAYVSTTLESEFQYFSMISRKFFEDNDSNHIDLLIMIDEHDNTISLRSYDYEDGKDPIDVSEIARMNGGGGHPRASGFSY